MGRLIGYMANRPDRLTAALHQERVVVNPAPVNGNTGWGVGFYQNGEVLHKKRPRFEPGAFNWEQIARDVSSDCVVLHLRQPTVGDFRTQNTHPFRMRRWLFAHTGTIDRFEAIEGRLRSSLPDFLQRNIRGTTDSEVFFHLVLSFLHDAGQLDGYDVDARVMLSATRSAVVMVDRMLAEVGGEPATLNLVLTNGRAMLVLRRGAPMAYVERRGLHEPPDDLPEVKPGAPNLLRYVMVAGGVDPKLPSPWRPMEDGQILIVDRNLSVHSHGL